MIQDKGLFLHDMLTLFEGNKEHVYNIKSNNLIIYLRSFDELLLTARRRENIAEDTILHFNTTYGTVLIEISNLREHSNPNSIILLDTSI